MTKKQAEFLKEKLGGMWLLGGDTKKAVAKLLDKEVRGKDKDEYQERIAALEEKVEEK